MKKTFFLILLNGLIGPTPWAMKSNQAQFQDSLISSNEERPSDTLGSTIPLDNSQTGLFRQRQTLWEKLINTNQKKAEQEKQVKELLKDDKTKCDIIQTHNSIYNQYYYGRIENEDEFFKGIPITESEILEDEQEGWLGKDLPAAVKNFGEKHGLTGLLKDEAKNLEKRFALWVLNENKRIWVKDQWKDYNDLTKIVKTNIFPGALFYYLKAFSHSPFEVFSAEDQGQPLMIENPATKRKFFSNHIIVDIVTPPDAEIFLKLLDAKAFYPDARIRYFLHPKGIQNQIFNSNFITKIDLLIDLNKSNFYNEKDLCLFNKILDSGKINQIHFVNRDGFKTATDELLFSSMVEIQIQRNKNTLLFDFKEKRDQFGYIRNNSMGFQTYEFFKQYCEPIIEHTGNKCSIIIKNEGEFDQIGDFTNWMGTIRAKPKSISFSALKDLKNIKIYQSCARSDADEERKSE